MDKKAGINISIRWIIIIIIAIVLLLLILALIRRLSEESDIRLEEGIARYGMAPIAVISSPSPVDAYTIFDDVTFDGSKSYDRNHEIVGYFWDIDSNSVMDSNDAVYKDHYWEPGEYNVTLKVINDAGAIGTASEIIRVVTKNEKKVNLRDSLFLVRDNDRANEKTILRLIPLTTWYDSDGFHSVPYYVYYVNESSGTLDIPKLEELMGKYEKNHAYVFDDSNIECNEKTCDPPMPWGIGCCDLSGGKSFVKVNDKIDELYFDFWEIYQYVVLVNTTETEASLIASLFAAFYNSPLIFIDNSNLDEYKDKITNSGKTKNLYCIQSLNAFDPSVQTFITTSGWDCQPYSAEQLRIGTVNRIVKLTSNVTMSDVGAS